MANSKQFLFDDKENRRLKTGINITAVLDNDGDVVIDLPVNITSNAATATLAEKVQFQSSSSKTYLLGSLSTISGQKPIINSSVYMSSGNLYATGFYGNGTGLTNLTPSNIATGTAPISITGTASKVGFTINSSGKTYLLGTTSTVADSTTTGEIKPTYSSYIYMQNNTLYADYFSGNGMYLTNVSADTATKDTSGNIITSSYVRVKKLLSGGTNEQDLSTGRYWSIATPFQHNSTVMIRGELRCANSYDVTLFVKRNGTNHAPVLYYIRSVHGQINISYGFISLEARLESDSKIGITGFKINQANNTYSSSHAYASNCTFTVQDVYELINCN